MIKLSQMKNVLPSTNDSFVLGETYICVKTTYKRLARERIEEFLPAKITHKHEPTMTVIAEIKDATGYDKDIVFNKTQDSRGLFVAKPEIKYLSNEGPQNAVSTSYILVRAENEWHTIKYMRSLAEVLISKMGNTHDGHNIAAMNFDQLESLRKIVWQIEYNRNQAAFYKECFASLDFFGGSVGYGKNDEWNCSFFDKHGNLHKFLADDFESMKRNFERALDRVEAIEKYGVVQYGDACKIYDKESGEYLADDFENIHKAKAFIKNKLSRSQECGKITSKGLENEN